MTDAAAPTTMPVEGWHHRHLLDVADLTLADLELVMTTADEMTAILARPIPKVPTLRGVSVTVLFYEASTRTRVSFEVAAKNLSADVVNIAAASSSVTKGESLVDTVRTIEALGADVLVMRHGRSGAPYLAAALREADAVMALRIQQERMAGGLLPSLREYAARYQLNAERLGWSRPEALVLHPGPMNEGVEIAPDVAISARSVITEQVANGVAVRMALLYLLTGGRSTVGSDG